MFLDGEGNGTPLQYSCLENPMDGGAWWAAVHGVATEWLHFHFSLSCIGERNGNPLQCSCLENPRDGGAWWATTYGVAQSWTRLKRLGSSSSMFLETCPFLQGLQICWYIIVHNILLFFFISALSIVIAPLSFLFIFAFIRVWLLYTFVLVPAVQQSESAICRYISPPSGTSFPFPT